MVALRERVRGAHTSGPVVGDAPHGEDSDRASLRVHEMRGTNFECMTISHLKTVRYVQLQT